MVRRVITATLVFISLINSAHAATYFVGSRDFPTIQSAVNAAKLDGDIVVVPPGVYRGFNNVNIVNTNGKNIIIKSYVDPLMDPNNPNWTYINQTVIDCQGNLNNATQAFIFQSGETKDCKVIGFTIRNGFMHGGKGADGVFGANPPSPLFLTDPANLDSAPIAEDGVSATGNGFGGAVYIVDSSPSFEWCIFENNIVTGAYGGKGSDGQAGPWSYTDSQGATQVTSDGQWGGNGGMGMGNGYGGAVACVTQGGAGCSPIFANCRFTGNQARGGSGGAGGNGGRAAGEFDGNAANGGDGGFGVGDGIGGAIYCDPSSSLQVINCEFTRNIASTGIIAAEGAIGPGNQPDDSIRYPGMIGGGFGIGGIAGGAIFMDQGTNNKSLTVTNCAFRENKAFEENPFDSMNVNGNDGTGGAVMAGTFLTNIKNSLFVGNIGGALHLWNDSITPGPLNTATVTGCTFENNINNAILGVAIPPAIPYLYSDTGCGGAIYVADNSSLTLADSTFNNNIALNDGGAVKSEDDTTIEKCNFSFNTAGNYGGAIDAYFGGNILNVEIQDCGFNNNKSTYGGAISGESLTLDITDSYFVNNSASIRGGGLDIAISSLTLAGGAVNQNSVANGNGGGITVRNMVTLDIKDCMIIKNSTNQDGGGLYVTGGTSQKIFNCLFDQNVAKNNGGALYAVFAGISQESVTFSYNSAKNGGAVHADTGSSVVITNSIVSNNSSIGLYEANTGVINVSYTLFFMNSGGDFRDYPSGTIYNAQTQLSFLGLTNKYGDPKFAKGPLGDLYLGSGSAAINSGDPAFNLSTFNGYTTYVNDAPDTVRLDMGYHYVISTTLAKYTLTTYVSSGSGKVTPASGSYFPGTVVTLTATPTAGWRVKEWSGADQYSKEKINYITMINNRIVSVSFDKPRTYTVGVTGGTYDFPNLQDAQDVASDGDEIIVYAGVYHGPQTQINKVLKIRSLHPDNPTYVAATVFEYGSNGRASSVIYFGPRAVGTEFNGFTIREAHWGSIDGADGTVGHPNGGDSGNIAGGAIHIASGSAPLIKNCVFRNNSITAGKGGNGYTATLTSNAGRGGWGGFARGGAVYVGRNTAPRFINCKFIDNRAVGGNGGDGGPEVDPGGYAGYGGNWSRKDWFDRPNFRIVLEYVAGDLWQHWGYFNNYRWYSGYGGAVYCDVNSVVLFDNCEMRGNTTSGGMSGQRGAEAGSGSGAAEPIHKYEIPCYGGAIYCAEDTIITFNECIIAENIALGEPNSNRLDPYLGHGGGIAAEKTAKIIIKNTDITDNLSDVGGGIWWVESPMEVSYANITTNRAFHGGGVFGQRGDGMFVGCNVDENFALSDEPVDANDPDSRHFILGSGGGFHLVQTNTQLIDCQIKNNYAESSGGGVYIGGETYPYLFNCLIAKNIAGRDGGGISANNYAQVDVRSCTIADNQATGAESVTALGSTSIGGGVYASYETFVGVTDSILWGNRAMYGSQIGLQTGFEFDVAPSEIDVTDCDIEMPSTTAAIPLDLVFCIDTTGTMSDDIDAIKASLAQILNAVEATFPDYRIAIVDFRSWPEEGMTDAYPFNDIIKFETDKKKIIDGVNSLEIGEGVLESTYSALIHCAEGHTLGGWRTGVNVARAILIMDDEPGTSPEPYTGYVIQDAINAVAGPDVIYPKKILAVAIGDWWRTLQEFQQLATGTGGTFINAADSTEVVDAIISALLSLRPSVGVYYEDGCIINGYEEGFNPIPSYLNYETFAWPSVSNIIKTNPLFVKNQLVGNYFLNPTSPCVNKDANDITDFPEFYRHTTRTDRALDTGRLDWGYHHILKSDFPGDLNFDGKVDNSDLFEFLKSWLGISQFPDWAQGRDINRDGRVDNFDYALLVDSVAKGDSEKDPPLPNPMTWLARPDSKTGATWISMSATQAFDGYTGENVFYQFEAQFGPGHSSGWTTSRTYVDTGLTTGKSIGYRVRCSDRNPDINPDIANITAWSPISYATVGQGTAGTNTGTIIGPTDFAATKIGDTSVTLTWKDMSSNENGFRIERRIANGGEYLVVATVAANVKTFSDSGLLPATTYFYRVRAYNLEYNSDYSNTVFVNTMNYVVTPQILYNYQAAAVDAVNSGFFASGGYAMNKIVCRRDAQAPGYYRLVCTSHSGFSNDWTPNDGLPNTWTHPAVSYWPRVTVSFTDTRITFNIAIKDTGTTAPDMTWRVDFSDTASNDRCISSAPVKIFWIP